MNSENAVTLEKAKAACAAWRTLLKEMYPGTADEHIFRGFYIPIEDINQLKTDYNAVAVRAYIATDEIPGTSDITGHRLRLMLVPVLPYEGQGMPGKDHIVNLHDPSDPDLVSIYDFTMPCPAQCDNGSPLYNIDSDK